jgi:hypothetical protein
VLTALDAEVFTVAPRDDGDVVRLAEMLSPELPEDVLHIVVGRSAPGQTDTPCAVAGLPVIVADQLLAFTLDEFAAALPVPDGADAGAIREVFLRLTRRSDNRGTSDEHRALNYLAVRYPDFYRVVLDAHERGLVTAAIDARAVPWAQRRVVAVRLAFRNRSEIAERYQCSVDVSEVFPFIVSPLARYYE